MAMRFLFALLKQNNTFVWLLFSLLRKFMYVSVSQVLSCKFVYNINLTTVLPKRSIASRRSKSTKEFYL